MYQADQARTDFVIIEDHLQAIPTRLARVPTPIEIARTALMIMLGAAGSSSSGSRCSGASACKSQQLLEAPVVALVYELTAAGKPTGYLDDPRCHEPLRTGRGTSNSAPSVGIRSVGSNTEIPIRAAAINPQQ